MTGKVVDRDFLFPKLFSPTTVPVPIEKKFENMQSLASQLSKISAETEELRTRSQIIQMQSINKKFQENFHDSNTKIGKEKLEKENEIEKNYQETKLAIEYSYASKSKANEDLLTQTKFILAETWSKNVIKTEIAMQEKRAKAYEKYLSRIETIVALYIKKLGLSEIRDVQLTQEKIKKRIELFIEDMYGEKSQITSLKKDQGRRKSL